MSRVLKKMHIGHFGWWVLFRHLEVLSLRLSCSNQIKPKGLQALKIWWGCCIMLIIYNCHILSWYLDIYGGCKSESGGSGLVYPTWGLGPLQRWIGAADLSQRSSKDSTNMSSLMMWSSSHWSYWSTECSRTHLVSSSPSSPSSSSSSHLRAINCHLSGPQETK